MRTYHSTRFQLMNNNVQRAAANPVSSYMENLEKLFTPDQIVSDSHFFRLNRRNLGCDTQEICIDHMKYQILDPSGHCKVRHCLFDFDVLIFVVSLTSCFQAPPLRRILMLIEKSSVTNLGFTERYDEFLEDVRYTDQERVTKIHSIQHFAQQVRPLRREDDPGTDS